MELDLTDLPVSLGEITNLWVMSSYRGGFNTLGRAPDPESGIYDWAVLRHFEDRPQAVAFRELLTPIVNAARRLQGKEAMVA